MGAIKPKIIGVLIDDENLGWDLISQRGFPPGHQWLSGAYDTHGGIAVADQFAIEFAAVFPSPVIGHAIDARALAEARGKGCITGNQIDLHTLAVTAAKDLDHPFHDGA